MRCDAVRARFVALEDGALPADEVAAVRAHLEGCEVCRGAWDVWVAESGKLRAALGPVRAPHDVAGAVVARLRADKRSGGVGRQRLVVRVAMVAAAVVAVAVGVMVYWQKGYVRVGRVAVVTGRPLVRQRGARNSVVAARGEGVYDGAELMTAPGERLGVMLGDGSRLELGGDTEVVLSGAGQGRECGHYLPHVCLHRGEVVCDLRSVRYFRGVGTPLGTAIVEGTRFRMRYVMGKWTVLEVLEGVVRFSCPGGVARAEAGTVWVVDSKVDVPRRVSGVFD